MNWKTFAKALVPALAGALLAGADMIASGHVDLVRIRALVAGLVTAGAVYLVPNAAPPLPPVLARPNLAVGTIPTLAPSHWTGINSGGGGPVIVTYGSPPFDQDGLTPAERRWGKQ